MIAETAAAASSTTRIEIVASDERFAAIGGAWEELWRRVDGLIFQDWAWVDAWRRTDPKRAERQLLVGLLWSGDRLDAVLALAIVRRHGVRVLEWRPRSIATSATSSSRPTATRPRSAASGARPWRPAATISSISTGCCPMLPSRPFSARRQA